MAKRRFISQLPSILQTQTLQKFFDSTVDQVFQPGSTTSVNAYIGRKPSYFDEVRDFYKAEISNERASYQLEPTMVARAPDETYSDVFFYPDLVNQLRFQGANVDDESRLFESDRYSWLPPINLHKLRRYHEYLWMPEGPPVLVLTGQTYSVEITTYATTIAIPSLTTDSKVLATVNGAFAPIDPFAGELSFHAPLVTGDQVFIVVVDTVSSYVGDLEEKSLDAIPTMVVDMNIEIREGVDTKKFRTIRLPAGVGLTDTTRLQQAQPDASYWVIERTDYASSKWSRANHWYHRSTNVYNWEGFTPTRAVRPIIEFSSDVKLANHGYRKLPDVDLVYSGVGDITTLDGFNLTTNGPVSFDGHQLFDGMGVLLPSNQVAVVKFVDGPVSPAIDDLNMYGNDEPCFDASGNFVGFIASAVLTSWGTDGGLEGDLVVSVTIPFTTRQYDQYHDTNTGEDRWFDGVVWHSSQTYDRTIPPQFDMFDQSEPPSLVGSTTIFEYKTGSTFDPFLETYVAKNKFGNPVFTDSLNSASDGIKFYAYGDPATGEFEFKTNWIKTSNTSQTVTDGVFSVPQNLQANPLNSEVTAVSQNEWFSHFDSILNANIWDGGLRTIDPSAGYDIIQTKAPLLKTMLLSSNSSLDFMKASTYCEREYVRFKNRFKNAVNQYGQSSLFGDVDATLASILQTLKTAKNPEFPFANNGIGDWYIPPSGAYLGMAPLWEPEFIVDRNTVNSFLLIRGHDGSLTPGYTTSTSLTETVDTIEIDDRDRVLLALEQLIYDSAMPALKGGRPDFDYLSVTPGKYRQTDYDRTEWLRVARPIFERWVTQNQYDSKANQVFNSTSPFTWNFSGLMDSDGIELPGYWRGIYRWFFDTDRPHSHPWEMLGHTSKPMWWDSLYSWTDSVKRIALVLAIETGTVDDAGTVNSMFARPGSFNKIPVSTSGELLDPVQAGIAPDVPFYDYSRDWMFGSGSPVEAMWLASHNCSFALAQLAYLMKPAQFVEVNWQTKNMALVQDQWLNSTTGFRAHTSTEEVVHNEVVNDVAVRVLGLQTWISDYLKSSGKSISTEFGQKVRTLGVSLAHKVGGFLDASNVKTYTENAGLLPQENVHTALYRSPSIKEEFYGGVILEWVGQGWKVYGYDGITPDFKVMYANQNGPKTRVTAVDVDSTEYPTWSANTYYQVGSFVQYGGSIYKGNKTHTSSSQFEEEFWVFERAASDPNASVVWYSTHSDDHYLLPYGAMLFSKQEVADFLGGYQAYLVSRGWSFDAYDSDTNSVEDWKMACSEFMTWASVNWEVGTFISLSPTRNGVHYSTPFGSVQNVEQLVNGVYSVLGKDGFSIQSSSVTTNRLDDAITVAATDSQIYGLRLFVSEVEQVLVFDNNTSFGDVVYEPKFNVRQDRIRLSTSISSDWNGRMEAPGFVISDNRLIPSFDTQVEDIRHTFDIEKSLSLSLRDHARHQIGYQARTYFDSLMYNEGNQFEFYQGMIRQKGAPGVFGKLMRNNQLTATKNLSFMEEWAFRTGSYGATDKDETFEFKLSSSDLKTDPQLVQFQDSRWGLFTYGSSLWDPSVGIDDVATLDQQDDTTVNLYSSGDEFEGRWLVPPKGDAFTTVDSYVTRDGWMPTAGYVRTTEVAFAAPSLNAFNSEFNSVNDDLVPGSRVWVYDLTGDWDVLRVTEVDSTPNLVAFAPSPTGVGTLIELNHAAMFGIGDIVFINKEIAQDENLSGMYRVLAGPSDADLIDALVFTAYDPANCIVIDTEITTDKNYDTLVVSLFAAKSVRVKSNSDLDVTRTNWSVPNYELPTTLGSVDFSNLDDGELVYVDVCYSLAFQHELSADKRRWVVFKKDGSRLVPFRVQPKTIRRDLIKDVRVFDTNPVRTDRQLDAKPLLTGDVVVYDPVQGLLPGVAMRDIWYINEEDPATYNGGVAMSVGNEWGNGEVGRLWWDVSTSKFLLCETDDILDATENEYRANNWGKLAPGSSVDIYEWTRSTTLPSQWQADFVAETEPNVYDGPVLHPDSPSWVEKSEWDSNLGKNVTIYYFWVKSRKYVPHKSFRKTSAYEVTKMITDPRGSGLRFVAPLTANSLILGGMASDLTTYSSVQITVARSDSQTIKHSEWKIMRDGDANSQPDYFMWNKIVKSLAGKDAWGRPLPNTSKRPSDQVGYDVEKGQNLFKDVRAARRHVVDFLNNMFADARYVDDRSNSALLNKSENANDELHWEQSTGSYYVQPMPVPSLWDNKVVATTQGTAESNGPSVNGELWYDLLQGEANWRVINSTHASSLESTPRYDYVAPSITSLGSITAASLPVGSKVLVNGSSATNGMWTLWKCVAHTSGMAEVELVQVQLFNASDCWMKVDWYADGFNMNTGPAVSVPTTLARDSMLLLDPSATFIKVTNDGTGRWSWHLLVDGMWTIVAREKGTIKINENVWRNAGDLTSLVGLTPSEFSSVGKDAILGRDRGHELDAMLNVLRDSILTTHELNQLFFSIVNYVHTEQDYVDWCFKTSFMFVTGYSDKLKKTPVANVDFTTNLLDYLNEVKPYHVKIRDFTSRYGIDDVAKVQAIDYDKPPYFDRSTGSTRPLDVNDQFDTSIMQNGIWRHWFMNWQDGSAMVRKLNTTLGVDYDSWASGVADDTYSDRVSVRVTSNVDLTVEHTNPGMMPVENFYGTGYAGSLVTQDSPFTNLAQSRTSLPVFVNGLRLDPDEVTYDQNTKKASFISPQSGKYEVMSFGYGSNGVVKAIKTFTKSSVTQTFDLGSTGVYSEIVANYRPHVKDDLLVTLGGEFTTNYTISNGLLTISSPANGMLQVAILATDGDVHGKVHGFSFKGTELNGKSFSDLMAEVDPSWVTRWPFSHNFIIEVDGYRKTPETIQNVVINSRNKLMTLAYDPEPTSQPGTGLVNPDILEAAFDHVVMPVSNGIYRPFTMPASTRSVNIGMTPDPASMVVVDVTGAISGVPGSNLIVGRLLSYNNPGHDIDPSNPPANAIATWEHVNQFTWEQWQSILDGDLSDDPSLINYSPANASLIIFEDHLLSFLPISGDADLRVTLTGHVPDDLTGYEWVTGTNIIKLGEQLLWVGTETNGLMTSTIYDGEFSMSDSIIAKYGASSVVTITDIGSPKVGDTRTHVYEYTSGLNAFPISGYAPLAHLNNGAGYWITKNGVKMQYGVDYVMVDVSDGYDSAPFDSFNLGGELVTDQFIVAGYGFNEGVDSGKSVYARAPMLDQSEPRREKLAGDFDWEPENIQVRFVNGVVSGDEIIITVFPQDPAGDSWTRTVAINDVRTTRKNSMMSSGVTGDVYDAATAILVGDKKPI